MQNFRGALICALISVASAADDVIKLIIDSDIGYGSDDVGAIAVAHYYAD
jgi:hypothetical protein